MPFIILRLGEGIPRAIGANSIVMTRLLSLINTVKRVFLTTRSPICYATKMVRFRNSLIFTLEITTFL